MRPVTEMWPVKKRPLCDDDLMEEWLMAVMDAQQRGASPEVLLATMEQLVDHLSSGVRSVVKIVN